jgi:segregation and condensation protein B
MKRKKDDAAPELQPEDLTPAVGGEAGWDGPTRAGDESELADLAAESLLAQDEADEAEGVAEEVNLEDASAGVEAAAEGSPADDELATERVSLDENAAEPAVVEREAVSESVSVEVDLGTEVLIADAASDEGSGDVSEAADAALASDEASDETNDVGEVAAAGELSAEAAAEESADGEIAAEAAGEGSEAAAGEGGAAVAGEGGEAAAGAEDDEDAEPPVESADRLESIVASLLFASDRALSVSDLKKLTNERDAKKLTAALEALRERHAETGIQLANMAGGWQFRTNPVNAPWVSQLIAGKPQRLSRAMLETLAIVAYRQPITRPEIDEIRGVDCGPVLKTLLDRGLVRILGKKEDVGRPMLYGTTPDFLKTFSLKDLSELPTLREFHELSEQQMAVVDAKAPLPEGAVPPPVGAPDAPRSPFAPATMDLSPVDQKEEDDLLAELETATIAASRASGPPPGQAEGPTEPTEPQS